MKNYIPTTYDIITTFEKDKINKDKWITIPCDNNGCRYALRTKGKKPIIVMGINPSTAHDEVKDSTIRSVEKIGAYNGFDSFIMMNICARRSTLPTNLEKEINEELHKSNIESIKWVLNLVENPVIWAAWGSNIEQRDYLKKCLDDILIEIQGYNVKWVHTYSIKNGHPKHPLYTKKSQRNFKEFDINSYIKTNKS